MFCGGSNKKFPKGMTDLGGWVRFQVCETK